MVRRKKNRLIRMPINKKGKKILREAGYKKFKKSISKAVASYIRDNPEVGADIHGIVKKTLEVEKFKKFYNNLTQKTRETVKLPEKKASKFASILVGEEISQEIKKKVPELVSSSDKKPEDYSIQKLHEKIRSMGILKGKYLERIVGSKTLLWQAAERFFRKRSGLISLIGVGATMIVFSGILLGSFYDALITALTLNAIPATSVSVQIGNILGGLGGVIIIFTSIAIAVTHFLEKERGRERISKLADEYLEKTK